LLFHPTISPQFNLGTICKRFAAEHDNVPARATLSFRTIQLLRRLRALPASLSRVLPVALLPISQRHRVREAARNGSNRMILAAARI
jgi:hypothetical protein